MPVLRHDGSFDPKYEKQDMRLVITLNSVSRLADPNLYYYHLAELKNRGFKLTNQHPNQEWLKPIKGTLEPCGRGYFKCKGCGDEHWQSWLLDGDSPFCTDCVVEGWKREEPIARGGSRRTGEIISSLGTHGSSCQKPKIAETGVLGKLLESGSYFDVCRMMERFAPSGTRPTDQQYNPSRGNRCNRRGSGKACRASIAERPTEDQLKDRLRSNGSPETKEIGASLKESSRREGSQLWLATL